MSSVSLDKNELQRRAYGVGAVACGVARCEPVGASAEEEFVCWLESGCHASMDYMARHTDLRMDPEGLLPGCRSVISFAFSYFYPDSTVESDVVFARYALGDDYHDVIRRRRGEVAQWISETTGAETRVCVDTAPLLERYWAVRAGIGFRGLNGLLIVPEAGSWVLLGEILTSAVIEPDRPNKESCGECRRCQVACPGKSINGDGTIDSRRCRSYLTIESREERLPEGLNLGKRIYGCDICQEVCPWNRKPLVSTISEFAPRNEIVALSRQDIVEMDQERFSAVFRKSAIKRAKLSGLRRNVISH